MNQLCHHYGLQLRVWVPRWPVHLPTWPQLGLPLGKASMWLLPCLRQRGVGVSSQVAGQQNSWSISSWRHLHPTPATAGLTLLVSPYTPGWPACPAPLPGLGWALVHLSGTRCLIKPPRKQGQPAGPAGAEEGAALGHVWPQGFSGPCSNNIPPAPAAPNQTGVWAT